MKDLILSAVLAGDSSKSKKFGLSATTELLAKFILLRVLMSALSLETVLRPIKLPKMDVECPCTDKIRLMGASSGSDFLALVAMMERLGLTIYWFSSHVGYMKVLLKHGLGGVNLLVATVVLMSLEVDLSLPVRITSLGVWKKCVPLQRCPLGAPSGARPKSIEFLAHLP